jgi:hypothetical protein
VIAVAGGLLWFFINPRAGPGTPPTGGKGLGVGEGPPPSP